MSKKYYRVIFSYKIRSKLTHEKGEEDLPISTEMVIKTRAKEKYLWSQSHKLMQIGQFFIVQEIRRNTDIQDPGFEFWLTDIVEISVVKFKHEPKKHNYEQCQTIF